MNKVRFRSRGKSRHDTDVPPKVQQGFGEQCADGSGPVGDEPIEEDHSFSPDKLRWFAESFSRT